MYNNNTEVPSSWTLKKQLEEGVLKIRVQGVEGGKDEVKRTSENEVRCYILKRIVSDEGRKVHKWERFK